MSISQQLVVSQTVSGACRRGVCPDLTKVEAALEIYVVRQKDIGALFRYEKFLVKMSHWMFRAMSEEVFAY
jgi:hypothetical protein